MKAVLKVSNRLAPLWKGKAWEMVSGAISDRVFGQAHRGTGVRHCRERRLLENKTGKHQTHTSCSSGAFQPTLHLVSTAQRKPIVPARSMLGAMSRYLPCSFRP